MEFVFGGDYQGMEEYVLEHSGHLPLVLHEGTTSIDFSAPALAGLELFVLGCVCRGESARAYFEAHREAWQHCILIGKDYSCGIVPMDAQCRLWREENGRLNNYLAAEATRVVRCFCGLWQVLK